MKAIEKATETVSVGALTSTFLYVHISHYCPLSIFITVKFDKETIVGILFADIELLLYICYLRTRIFNNRTINENISFCDSIVMR